MNVFGGTVSNLQFLVGFAWEPGGPAAWAFGKMHEIKKRFDRDFLFGYTFFAYQTGAD